MFVDASAILAIIKKEPEAELFTEKLKNAAKIYASAMSRYEAVAGLVIASRKEGQKISAKTIADAVSMVDDFFDIFNIRIVSIDENVSREAIEAFANYGRGTGHRAQLNMGDCFSYGVARAHKLPLLFKGNDFVHTDIRKA